jgi:hypothetical protein
MSVTHLEGMLDVRPLLVQAVQDGDELHAAW